MKLTYSNILKVTVIVLMSVCLCIDVNGATSYSVSEYRVKLSQARELSETLRAEITAELETDETEYRREMREILPEGLVIESNNELNASNQWLTEELKALEKAQKSADKIFALTKIIERIRGIENRLGGELVFAKTQGEPYTGRVSGTIKDDVPPISSTPKPKPSVQDSISKAEARAKVEEILKRPEYAEPERNKSILSRWWEDFRKWWNSLFEDSLPDIEAPSPTTASSLGEILQVIVILAALILIGILVWRFAPYFQSARRLRREKDDGTRVILGETLRADENSATLWQEAEKLAAEGNRRAAIRKGYIAVLCELGDRRVVRLAQHKTNGDYLKDVRQREGLYTAMRNLTGSFERHWYGDESADENAWAEFREGYGKALKQNA